MADENSTQDIASDAPNADAGGKAHTGLDEGHPAGTGERSDREVGGPKLDDGAEGSEGGE